MRQRSEVSVDADDAEWGNCQTVRAVMIASPRLARSGFAGNRSLVNMRRMDADLEDPYRRRHGALQVMLASVTGSVESARCLVCRSRLEGWRWTRSRRYQLVLKVKLTEVALLLTPHEEECIGIADPAVELSAHRRVLALSPSLTPPDIRDTDAILLSATLVLWALRPQQRTTAVRCAALEGGLVTSDAPTRIRTWTYRLGGGRSIP